MTQTKEQTFTEFRQEWELIRKKYKYPIPMEHWPIELFEWFWQKLEGERDPMIKLKPFQPISASVIKVKEDKIFLYNQAKELIYRMDNDIGLPNNLCMIFDKALKFVVAEDTNNKRYIKNLYLSKYKE